MEKAELIAKLWEMAIGHSCSFGMRAAVVLGIPAMLVKAMTIEEIGLELGLAATNLQIGYLMRLMKFLAMKGLFSKDEENRYGLTRMSRLLSESQFAGLCLAQDEHLTAGWHHLADAILHGGPSPYVRAKGKPFYSYMQDVPQVAKTFADAMVSMSNVTMHEILEHYHGFQGVHKVLVDVAGAMGTDVARVVAAYPHIKGINFDLPHMVEHAPAIPGVEHVAGDMFEGVPVGDAYLMKATLHIDDEHALKALTHCYNALPEGGKVIIVDVIMEPSIRGPFDDLKFAFDLVLSTVTENGMDRTEKQWMELIKKVGFNHINVVKIPTCLQDVIEAYKSRPSF